MWIQHAVAKHRQTDRQTQSHALTESQSQEWTDLEERAARGLTRDYALVLV